MSRVEGQLLTCDRCGQQVFQRLIKTEHLSGGFERSNTYEPCAAGWSTGKMGCRDLCPECTKQADFIVGNFKQFCGNCASEIGSSACKECSYPLFSGWVRAFDTNKLREPTVERSD